MEQKRARELCEYLQKKLCPSFPLWEILQSLPGLRVTLYKRLELQQESLCDALKKAFRDVDSLQGLIEQGLCEDFGDIPAKEIFNVHIFAAIKWAAQEGYLLELIAAASIRKPDNPYIRAFIMDTLSPLLEEILTSVPLQQLSMISLAPASPLSEAKAHPDISKRTIQQHISSWPEMFAIQKCQRKEEALTSTNTAFVSAEDVPEEHQRCICRIEVPLLKPAGTGFLFRTGIVITNYHVMRPVFEELERWDQVILRFDYHENNKGTRLSQGVEYMLTEAWHKAENAELDYVLLCLNPYPRTTSFVGGNDLEQRGYLKTQKYIFCGNEPIWILQHPSGAPLRTTKVPGKISDVDRQKQRVYYTTQTLNGSSGSPCMLQDGSVVALHSHGNPVANEGIPFSAILNDLSRKGLL